MTGACSYPVTSGVLIFEDTIMIKDRPYDRAVEVTVIVPDGTGVINLQELAERAWRALGRTITVDGVTSFPWKTTVSSR
jgi:hypothetical protein